MRKKLVVGNWKMHGSLAANRALLEGIRGGMADVSAQLAVCVPYPYLGQVQAILLGTPLAWGAQNVSEHAKGAHTGEVSASMLADFACRYVIVGHSERRAMYGDSDGVVAAKFAAARAQGLTPILCVGETLAEREAGVTEAVVARQLDAVTDLAQAAAGAQAVIAYEPVWAIGTGRTATPQQAQEIHALIRARVGVAEMCILYGGSVKPDNAAELFRQADIDGGLIGGASLAAADFLAICAATQR